MDSPSRSTTTRRWYAVGDPQTSEEALRSILDRLGLLAGHHLRDDVGLVSIGDHFDYQGEREAVAENGIRILSFLAEHPPEQVVILAGNHDLSRVMELSHEDDDSFARAQTLASEVASAPQGTTTRAEAEARFAREFPRIPSPGIAARDYSSFNTRQRDLVQRLLVTGRMRLACTGRIGTETALLTHAGITKRELALLGVTASDGAPAIARALNEWLATAVAKVTEKWARGEHAALDLAPLHVAGTTGREGGGLLYHRPANPDRPLASPWETEPGSPRRFDPRTLPRGLVQVAGHSGHNRCVRELDVWVTERARAQTFGELRTLRSDGDTVVYDLGVANPGRDEATLYMIDGDMNHPRAPTSYELLSLDEVHPPA